MAGTCFLPSSFYIPKDEITPLVGSMGDPTYFVWQAFPWLKPFYTNLGEYL